jgi:hypothetical protein
VSGVFNQCNTSTGTPCSSHQSCTDCNADSSNQCSWCYLTPTSPFSSVCISGNNATRTAICHGMGGAYRPDECFGN